MATFKGEDFHQKTLRETFRKVLNTFLVNITDQKILKGLPICWGLFPEGSVNLFYLLKVNNRNTRTRCEIYLKLAIKTPEQRHWRLSFLYHWSLRVN